MKFFKKIMPLVLAVMLCFTALPLSAATKNVEAGSSTTVSIKVKKGFGGEGTVVVSDPKNIVESYSIAGSNLGSFQENNNKIAFANSAEIKNGSINVTVKIKSSAKAGNSCTVSVSGYEYVDANDNMVSGSLDSQTITIKAKESSSSNKKPSSSTSSSNKTQTVDKTDYTELKKQIGIAEGLDKAGYTKESWDALQAALQEAYNALGCGDQSRVDAAAKALADAIAGLVKMDYSKLQSAIDSANNLITSDELAQLWNQLFQKLLNAEGLLTSDDQAAVDAAAEEILALLEQIKALLNPVEDAMTEPEGEYCNIPMHKVWPILFFVSLAANVGLVIILVGKKKKKEDGLGKVADHTPMVDYQIGDDDK